ncbi:alanine racemase [Ornithinibacillus contaminans]|uniref:alanine racemase n=1 Tax=Ornithinibacillus contaminans TaxID=694055 RepID=UPI00064DD4A5|nr:alanine racemase [Ornithinibacillus contaminans]
MVDMFRDTWAEINLNAITYNLEQIKEKLPEDSEIMAVVKANAYGHGIVPVAKQALASGATALAVALLEEAMLLRKASIDAPILVLGWVSPAYASVAAANNITLTFFQREWLEQLSGTAMERPVQVHLKLDTGMGRIGVRAKEELIRILREIEKNKNVKLTGVFTHYATADAEELDYFYEQSKRLEELLSVFYENWTEPVSMHVANSATSIRFPEKTHNFIRFGISMYGLYPSPVVRLENKISLKPAFSLHSKLAHVKKISKGESVSYGKTYTAKQDEWIGTIPIGYGDGWNRKLQGSSVLVAGKRMPIVGRICMDQTMIRLDQAYPIGTKVTLIGEQGEDRIEMDELAMYLDTINYEIPCMINDRIPRIYQG